MRLFLERLAVVCFILFFSGFFVEAQKKRYQNQPKTSQNVAKATVIKGIVIDNRLSVLRSEPSFYADIVQRMRIGRIVLILDEIEVDNVSFYKISAPPKNFGWVQTEAVIIAGKKNEDSRLAQLIQTAKGFDQIELISVFLKIFPKSVLRPSLLLLFGDLLEEYARKLSVEANRRLNSPEIRVNADSLTGFYLNYSGLDRFRRLGIIFLFNPNTKKFHYNGASWKEILKKFSKTPEAEESQKRLDLLKEDFL